MATTATKNYSEAVGRRKTAVARVRVTEGAKTVWSVNDKPLEGYFKSAELIRVAQQPFTVVPGRKLHVSVHVRGGGINAQAEAMAMGLARVLQTDDKDQRIPLKKAGLLKRDAREKERRKFGLKKARKRGKWSKR